MEKREQAPLATLSGVAPSLEATPIVTPTKDCTQVEMRNAENAMNTIVHIFPEKNEVTFKDYSITSSSSSTDEDIEKPNIPDGEWGWIVVFASFILSMIADGISFSFGLLYVEFLNEFNASSSVTSWIGSLFMAVPLISGPIMSALVDKYGCRSMTIAGGIISAFGFTISSQVNSIGVMYLTFGTLSGLGLGLCYVTAVVSIAFWFDKKRTLAVGIGASGTGVGTFVFAPLTNLLIHEFGWRGTTLILGGLFLNMCVCGMLMRDPDWIVEQNKVNSKHSKSSKSSKTSLVSLSSTNFMNSININELKDVLKSGKDADYLLQDLKTSIENQVSENKKSKTCHSSVLNLPTFIKQNEMVPIEVLEQLSSNKKLYNIILENYPSLLLCRSTSDTGLNKLIEDGSIIERVPVRVCMKLKKQNKQLVQQNSISTEDHLEVQEPLLPNEVSKTQEPAIQRNATFPWLKQQFVQAQRQHYFKNVRFHRQSLIHRGATFSTNKYRFKASSCPNIYRLSALTLQKDDEKWYAELLELVKGMLDFSLFLELHFLLLSLSTIILFVWFIVPYFYLADHMLKFEYTDEDASFTIANIGITNTIGMIVLGWAGDQPWMNITKTYAISLVLCGISCAGIMYFTTNFIMLEICAGMFGLFLSSSFSFTPGIIVELVPLDRFTVAYGLQLLCMGIGILVGPPYAGHLFDVTNSWEQAFYQAGIWIIISGILVAIIPHTKNRRIIGKKSLEKELEGAEDRLFYSIALILLLVVSIVVAIYFTIQCLWDLV
ncbi:monocarboxylate transporter 9 [Leptinotarsa decemlineata]|uniref:monocarboxylate transporter 9 n=1 Tax=Leptinotarsa decemlineata TaxID=7539 RepID=UPI003D309490